MLKTGTLPETVLPDWYDGKHLDEVIFCQEFLERCPMKSQRCVLYGQRAHQRRESAEKTDLRTA